MYQNIGNLFPSNLDVAKVHLSDVVALSLSLYSLTIVVGIRAYHFCHPLRLLQCRHRYDP